MALPSRKAIERRLNGGSRPSKREVELESELAALARRHERDVDMLNNEVGYLESSLLAAVNENAALQQELQTLRHADKRETAAGSAPRDSSRHYDPTSTPNATPGTRSPSRAVESPEQRAGGGAGVLKIPTAAAATIGAGGATSASTIAGLTPRTRDAHVVQRLQAVAERELAVKKERQTLRGEVKALEAVVRSFTQRVDDAERKAEAQASALEAKEAALQQQQREFDAEKQRQMERIAALQAECARWLGMAHAANQGAYTMHEVETLRRARSPARQGAASGDVLPATAMTNVAAAGAVTRSRPRRINAESLTEEINECDVTIKRLHQRKLAATAALQFLHRTAPKGSNGGAPLSTPPDAPTTTATAAGRRSK